MTQVLTGANALDALNQSDDSGNKTEFASFSSGAKYFVKVLGAADLISFYSYGIYKQVNSFVAANPSKKTERGFPVDDLTPWDKAFLYHRELSKDFGDHHSQEAAKYRPKQRFAMGFFDLETGEPIIVDVSKNQAQAIHSAIKKNEKRLDRFAFELSKEGSGTGTKVNLTPVLDMEEDLTDKQRANFEKAPAEFDMTLFNGLLYEADEKQQIENLIASGFDISLIGLSRPAGDDEEVTPIEDDPANKF